MCTFSRAPAGIALVLLLSAAGASCGGDSSSSSRGGSPSPPEILSVVPSQGPTSGGTSITVSGRGFVPGAQVTVGGIDATGIVVTSAYQITAVTPPNPSGPADVIVTTAGRQDTLIGGFLYGALPPDPIIYSVTPPNGPVQGGGPVTIIGDSFQPGAWTTIGGAPLVNEEFVSFSIITGIVPPGTSGYVDVVVTNPDGRTGIRFSGYQYLPDPTFFITGIAPRAGDMAGLTPVSVDGGGFAFGMDIALGGAPLLSPFIADPWTFTGETPPAAAPGPVDVVATDATGTQTDIIVDGFIYTAGPPPLPWIDSLTPDQGSPGVQVTIQGQEFGPTPPENLVLFDGAPAIVHSASATELVVTVPPDAATGQVHVEVQGVPSNGVPFTLTSPRIDSIFPSCSAAIGDDVTVLGENFSPDPSLNVVRFNGAIAPVLAAGPTFVAATVPPEATAGPLTVEVGGQVSPGVFFLVLNFLPDPALILATPTAGAVGSVVTLTGTDFSPTPGNNLVRFSGVVATVLAASATSLDAVVPAGATTGNVTLRVGGRDAPSGLPFTVTSPPPPPPTLLAITPDAGSVGDPVYLEGAGFHLDPWSNRVEFNGVPGEVAAGSPTWLLVSVPLGTSGLVTVDVGGQVSGGLPFTINGQTTGTESVDLFGQVVPLLTDRVTYVIDTSGSMSLAVPDFVDRFGVLRAGSRLDFVVDRVISSIQALAATVRFNIFSFNCGRQSWATVTRDATPTNVADAEAWLLGLVANGGTATGPALFAALQERECRTLLLITDGQPNCGASGTTGHTCVALNANDQQAEIHTFGIGATGPFQQFLIDLAALTGGTYTDVVP